MDKILIKIFKVVSAAIIVLGLVFIVLTLMNGDALETDTALQDKILNPFFFTSYIALIICAIAAIVFPILQLIQNPRNLVKALIVLAAFAVLGFISWSVAGNQFNAEQLQRLEITENTSKSVGAALIFTYIMIGLTILTTVYAGVSNLFKR